MFFFVADPAALLSPPPIPALEKRAHLSYEKSEDLWTEKYFSKALFRTEPPNFYSRFNLVRKSAATSSVELNLLTRLQESNLEI